MRRNIVGIVWLVGILLTVAVYQIGPDRIVWAGFEWMFHLRAAVDALFAALAVNTFELMRAVAIGLCPVFVVLSLLAARRGVASRGALVVVSLVFVLLLAAPLRHGEMISDARWTGAFLLMLIGSLSMTRRLALPGRPDAAWAEQAPWPSRPR